MSDINPRLLLLADALESGEFTQTKHCLRDDSGHCCLGVACEVFNRATKHGEWSPHRTGTYRFLGEAEILPIEVAEWFGMEEHGNLRAPYMDNNNGTCLTSLNDNGETFQQIAARIRAGQLVTIGINK
jgi:hypothetical protein